MQINSSVQVATAGEALIDFIAHADGRFEPCLGGAVYNLTRALARQEVGTLYLNPLSRDRFGQRLAQGLVDDGVHLAVPEPVVQVTSLAVVNVNEQGHPDYAFYREGVADRATTATALTQACHDLEDLTLVCTGALALSPDDADTYLPWLAAQRQAGRTVVIDANLRPSVMPNLEQYRRHVLTALQYADVIKASDEDLACLNLPGANALAQAQHLLHSSRASVMALTLGAEGAALLTRHGQVFQAQEQAPVSVVDTVGAGDCFLAGLVAAMLGHKLSTDWGSAAVAADVAKHLLGSAIASASLCVMRRGCVPPTRAEVALRLEQHPCVFIP
ncbi:MAG: PfkB family carbohydrate kinase [Rhodoferax sp.]|uniref:PfkB family carbohydrate kinase n=1 Tax=Rhodoferax sp. TaxID=50421 RepID=UPI00260FB8F1|nr:PfkB family carbohydrate kinase [Rhodoferax sp.]MDD2880823.1 PfkB family carbohydrate kinase [Rhodoferax sp.]